MFSMMLTKADKPKPPTSPQEAARQPDVGPSRHIDSARSREPDQANQSGGAEAGDAPAVAATEPSQAGIAAPACHATETALVEPELATASADDEATGDPIEAATDVVDPVLTAVVETATPVPPAPTPAPAVAASPVCAAPPAPPADTEMSDVPPAGIVASASGANGASASGANAAAAAANPEIRVSPPALSPQPTPPASSPQATPPAEPIKGPPDAAAPHEPDRALATAQSETPTRPVHAAAPPFTGSPKQPARDPIDRPTGSHPPSDLVAPTRPDGLHLTALLGGHDLGPMVAATAPAAAAKDGTSLAAVTVPLDGLAVEIAARANHGRNRFEIRLDPPELGRIEVRLDIDRSGQITSRLVVDRTETLDVLRRDAHQLERALQDAGLQTANNGLQFTLRDQGFSDRSPSFDRPHGALVDADQPVADGTSVALTLRGNGGVDIRV
jgi:flagellar hook-length control protein FliK